VTCPLHEALGREEECPGEGCALWTDHCGIEKLRLELRERPQLAAHLLELRTRLEQLRPSS
jgi:hypothetical protein